MVRELPGIAAIEPHGPEVVAAVLVAHHDEAVLPYHGALDGSVKGDLGGFPTSRQVVAPHFSSRAAPVVANIVAGHVNAQAGEEERSACRIHAGLVGVREGQGGASQGLRVHHGDHRGPAGAEFCQGGIEHLTLRCPA